MPRRIRSADLETEDRTAQAPGAKEALCGAGRCRRAPPLQAQRQGRELEHQGARGKGGYWSKGFAHADDIEAANGGSILDYWQAIDRARVLARSNAGEGDKPITVAAALDQYEADLRARNGDAGSAARVRAHLPGTLTDKLVSTLTARDLQRVRDAMLAKGSTRDTINRTGSALKAALTLAANRDERIGNRSAWRIGLARLPNAGRPRNVILADDKVIELIGAAYVIDRALGLMVEVAAVTGARAGQLARLEVQDLQDDPPRLFMPASRKGRGREGREAPGPNPHEPRGEAEGREQRPGRRGAAIAQATR